MVEMNGKKNVNFKADIEKYGDLFDHFNDIVFLIGDQGKLKYANEAAVKKYGYSHEEFMKMKIYDIRRSTDPELVNMQIAEAANHGVMFETFHHAKDGSIFPVEVNSSGTMLDGSFTLISVVRDITERKKIEESLLKLTRAVEQSSSIILITDTEGNIEYVNPRFTMVTGYAANEVIGKNPRILKSGYQDQAFYAVLWSTITAGNEWKSEIRNKKKDNSYYWALATISPVKRNGILVNYIEVQEDITVMKLTNEELQKSYDEMNRLLIELKQTQTQLVQHEKLAGVGQLAAGVAHEINNPLAFVTSNFEILSKYCGIIAEYLKHIEENDFSCQDSVPHGPILPKKIKNILADTPGLLQDTKFGLERITTIVKSMKSFSRGDVGEIRAEYDLNDGIRQTLTVAGGEIKYVAAVELRLEKLPLIMADGGKINQVLLNLLMNAVYAVKCMNYSGGGEIIITTNEQNNGVEFSITDNGPGIPDEHISKIFDLFFTTKPVGEGTGMGLGLAYDIIVNKHHGIMDAKNLSSGGACFRFWLPYGL